MCQTSEKSRIINEFDKSAKTNRLEIKSMLIFKIFEKIKTLDTLNWATVADWPTSPRDRQSSHFDCTSDHRKRYTGHSFTDSYLSRF